MNKIAISYKGLGEIMFDLLNYVCENTNFVDLKLYQYGMQKCAPLHRYGPAVRQNFVFHYILSGEGTFKLYNTNEVLQLKANQGFLIFPNEICTYEASQANPWHYTWVEFNGLQVLDCMLRAGFSETQPVFTQIASEQPSRLREQLLYL